MLQLRDECGRPVCAASGCSSSELVVSVDLKDLGARVVSVYGPFNSLVMFEMSADRAAELFPDGFVASARSNVIDATERDIERIRKASPELADSALAAATLALAYAMEHPYTSATAKANCHARIQEAMDRLRELAPPEQKKDDLDDIAAARARRLASRGQ